VALLAVTLFDVNPDGVPQGYDVVNGVANLYSDEDDQLQTVLTFQSYVVEEFKPVRFMDVEGAAVATFVQQQKVVGL
jgi:hypothetical protein